MDNEPLVRARDPGMTDLSAEKDENEARALNIAYDMAEWHVGDGDEWGTAARAFLASGIIGPRRVWSDAANAYVFPSAPDPTEPRS